MSLTQTKPLELLVVEDNPGDVLLLKEYLNLSHVPVRSIYEAGSVKDVPGILKNHEVDLVFLDLSLPDSEGIYSFISLNSHLPHTPIIVLTGLSDLNVALEALSLGAQDYVMKSDFNEKLLYKSIQYSIERKKMMEKLRESNERYEIVSRATNDLIWDWDLETGKIFNNTEGIKSIYGFDYKNAPDTINKWLLRIHPNDLENVKKVLDNSTGARSGSTFTFEYRFRREDDSYAYIFDRGYVMRNEEGKATRIIGAAQDITERKKAEQKLKKEKELSDSIINSLPGIFYIYNEKGNFLRWNKNFETVSGYTPAELLSMKAEEFFDSEQREASRRRIAKVFQYGYAWGEANFLTKTGSKLPYYFTGLAIDFEDEPCMIGTGIDISERKKSERETQLLNEQLRSLTAHVQNVREEEQTRIAREIHDELGQQITGLKMDVSWLRKKLNTNIEPMAMQSKLNTMTTLLDETVQTIRKISSELRPSILDDIGMVAALDWHGQEFQKRFNIPVSFSSTSKEMQVTPAVATGMFRIYQESLTNVARHAEAKEVLTNLQQKEDMLILTITDDGKGFVMDPSGKKKTLGMLGMKERALMIGATLDIQSEPGKGTSVIITVPIASGATV